MKISLNWVKEYTNLDLNVDELVAKIGAQLGAVEEVEYIGKKYEGIIISKVVSCERHPNADRLNVCLIDDGGKEPKVARNEKGLVQVVCGAPNVKAGQTIAWLPPGSTVPATFDKDPLVLEARELRGVVSNGMIASSKELAIGDDHSGILVLEDVKPGTDFAEHYGLDDYIIDIENKMFTHRPDCFGILGVAREISGVNNQAFKSPDWYIEQPSFKSTDSLPLTIRNEVPALVPRFMAVAMSGVEVKLSPVLMQTKLMRVGLKPINNVVDITNYLMYLTGQPLHAYDYEKVRARSKDGATITIRQPEKNEKVKLLNGKTITPRAEAIMIATDKELIGVGGVMGGADTEVDENTKDIILECATFDMYSVRRTSMEHGLFTDAVTRFNKGQSPAQNGRVLAEAMTFIEELAGGKQASAVSDAKPPKTITWWPDQNISAEFINGRLGLDLSAPEIQKLLANVEFKVHRQGSKLQVAAPFWRTDIHIAEDVVEEVGRLYGFDKLPLESPLRISKPTPVDKMLDFKRQTRHKLAALGANEVLTYSFLPSQLLEKTGQSPKLAFEITNALSPDLQYYRMSLTPSLLAHVHQNIKAGFDRFALFEINKAHNKMHTDDDHGVPREYEMLSLVYADKDGKGGPAYYQAKAYLDELADSLGIRIDYRPITKEVDIPVVKPFDPKRSALAFAAGSDVTLGIIGEFKPSVRSNLKLPVRTAGFEIGLQELMAASTSAAHYRPLSRFPGIVQDICLQVPSAVTYREVTTSCRKSLEKRVSSHEAVDWYPLDIYSSDELKGKKRITYRVKLTSYDRTLTDEVLTKLLDSVSADLKTAVGAERI